MTTPHDTCTHTQLSPEQLRFVRLRSRRKKSSTDAWNLPCWEASEFPALLLFQQRAKKTMFLPLNPNLTACSQQAWVRPRVHMPPSDRVCAQGGWPRRGHSWGTEPRDAASRPRPESDRWERSEPAGRRGEAGQSHPCPGGCCPPNVPASHHHPTHSRKGTPVHHQLCTRWHGARGHWGTHLWGAPLGDQGVHSEE